MKAPELSTSSSSSPKIDFERCGDEEFIEFCRDEAVFKRRAYQRNWFSAQYYKPTLLLAVRKGNEVVVRCIIENCVVNLAVADNSLGDIAYEASQHDAVLSYLRTLFANKPGLSNSNPLCLAQIHAAIGDATAQIYFESNKHFFGQPDQYGITPEFFALVRERKVLLEFCKKDQPFVLPKQLSEDACHHVAKCCMQIADVMVRANNAEKTIEYWGLAIEVVRRISKKNVKDSYFIAEVQSKLVRHVATPHRNMHFNEALKIFGEIEVDRGYDQTYRRLRYCRELVMLVESYCAGALDKTTREYADCGKMLLDCLNDGRAPAIDQKLIRDFIVYYLEKKMNGEALSLLLKLKEKTDEEWRTIAKLTREPEKLKQIKHKTVEDCFNLAKLDMVHEGSPESWFETARPHFANADPRVVRAFCVLVGNFYCDQNKNEKALEVFRCGEGVVITQDDYVPDSQEIIARARRGFIEEKWDDVVGCVRPYVFPKGCERERNTAYCLLALAHEKRGEEHLAVNCFREVFLNTVKEGGKNVPFYLGILTRIPVSKITEELVAALTKQKWFSEISYDDKRKFYRPLFHYFGQRFYIASSDERNFILNLYNKLSDVISGITNVLLKTMVDDRWICERSDLSRRAMTAVGLSESARGNLCEAAFFDLSWSPSLANLCTPQNLLHYYKCLVLGIPAGEKVFVYLKSRMDEQTVGNDVAIHLYMALYEYNNPSREINLQKQLEQRFTKAFENSSYHVNAVDIFLSMCAEGFCSSAFLSEIVPYFLSRAGNKLLLELENMRERLGGVCVTVMQILRANQERYSELIQSDAFQKLEKDFPAPAAPANEGEAIVVPSAPPLSNGKATMEVEKTESVVTVKMETDEVHVVVEETELSLLRKELAAVKAERDALRDENEKLKSEKAEQAKRMVSEEKTKKAISFRKLSVMFPLEEHLARKPKKISQQPDKKLSRTLSRAKLG